MAQEGREIIDLSEITIKDVEKVLLEIFAEPKKDMIVTVYGRKNIKAYKDALKANVYGRR